MKVTCSSCGHSFSLPDDRVQTFQSNVTVPCPDCKKGIAIDFQSQIPPATAYGAETGEALKEKVLQSVEDLPPMPQVAHKARQVVSNPDSNFEDLAKVIETDQAIAATVLKLANSAYYGSMGTVSSVQRAAVILGSNTLMELLNLACSAGPISRRLTGYDLDAGDLWKHSLAVAAGAKILAKDKQPELADDAFSAGLIHDVGKVILDPYILERKDSFEKFVCTDKTSFLSAEKEILGFDHGEIAAGICEKWQIPENLASAIQYHHHPLESDGNILACILHVADAIAMMTGIGGGLDGMFYQVEEKALALLKLDESAISLLMGEVVEYVENTVEGT